MPDQLTINDVRTVLAQEIQKLQDGETTPANANAIINATGKILASVKVQMEYHRITGKPLPDMTFLNAPALDIPKGK